MSNYPVSHLKTALTLAVLLALIITALPAKQDRDLSEKLISLEVPPAVEQDFEEDTLLAEAHIQTPPNRWTHIEVKPGDNLARIFQRIGLTAADLQRIVSLGNDAAALRKIMPGQVLSFELSATGELLSVNYKKDAFDTLIINRTGDNFVTTWNTATPEKILVYESATITRERPSLYHAGKAAGLSDNIIMELSDIFQWDISFALDLRTGDSFSLLYEEIYVDGEKAKEGSIVAAVFTNVGKTYDAVQYTDVTGRSGYYSPSGFSMRKAFLRDPVHFSHVSSSFNLRRLHPIHKRAMPHRGIDYAAKQGTPVVASGDGRVTIRRQNNASGKYIVIQHGERYTTKYLHLSAFARGIKPGKSVKQGQTIGYVGATGWATGPHLHYEFLVNGVHRNPKTVALPQASPVPSGELNRFRAATSPVLAQLRTIAGGGFASATAAPATGG